MMTVKTAIVKVAAISIILVLFSIAIYPAFAQETTSTSAIKEGVVDKTTTIKAKLKNFRDQKKASAAARINENLNKINDKQTSQMLKHLDKMSLILTKLENRVNSGKPDIKDVTVARSAIDVAKTKIASAEGIVKAQADKDYTISITSEAKVREDAKKQREMLHADLKATRSQVIEAKQSVAAAIAASKEGVNSGQ